MLKPAIQGVINAAVDKVVGNKREISVSFGRTINTGNYSSLKLDTRVIEIISKDENMDDAYKRLWNEAFNQVERAEKAFIAKQTAQIKVRTAKKPTKATVDSIM